MTRSFATEDMAVGYAQHRPPVHERVFELLELSTGTLRVHRALDLGCGAGLSTRVLPRRASQVIGLDPSASMLRWATKLVPDAGFMAASAEAIPLGAGTVDLVTAAGSLNYSQSEGFFGEAARVLTSEGRLLIYDFEPGRLSRDAPGLEPWFEEFSMRYPWPQGDAREIQPETLGTESEQFGLDIAERFRIPIAMTLEAYADYMMTETNVAAAVGRSVSAQDIRHWCVETLNPIWSNEGKEILFNGYFAQLRRKP